MTGRSRWPELEATLTLNACFQMLALVGAVGLAFAFTEADAPAEQIAVLAGLGALTGFVMIGVLDVWFYVRPTEIEFRPRRKEPSIVIGMVPQVAELLLMVCVVLVAVSLSWQFGHEQMSLTKRGAGPYVPVAFVATGVAGLILWRTASWLPGWRTEVTVTSRGIEVRGTGTPFTVGWDAVTAIREVNNPGSFFPPSRIRENYIAIDTLGGSFRIQPQDLKPSPYDVFLMLKQLHEEPVLRSRIGQARSTVQLFAPVTEGEAAAQPTAGDLPVSKPRDLRVAIVGLVVAAVAVPFAIYRAGDTPFFTTEVEGKPGSRDGAPADASDDALKTPDFGDGATCRDLHSSRAALARLLAGLEKGSSGNYQGPLPAAQALLNAAEAVANYAETELERGFATRWKSYSAELERGAETVWYTEQTDAAPPVLWKFVVQQSPNLSRATRQALAAIDAECP